MSKDELEGKVFHGGSVITMNDNQPTVKAVGIQGEHIIAVGTLEEVKKEMSGNYHLIDLEGKILLPGFIESHMHPISLLFFLVNVDLSACKSLVEIQDVIIKAAKEKPLDELIFGYSLREEQFDIPILPTKWDLDTCTNPVFMLRYDGHIGIANSKALELMEIDVNTKVPDGGEIRRNENGDITGVISEEALDLVFSKATKYLIPKPDVIKKTATKAFNFLAEKGITSIHGVFNYGREEGGLGLVEIPLYKLIQDEMLQNCYAMVCTNKPNKLTRLKKPPIDGGKIDSKFKLNTLKLFLDGSFGAKTACMWEPFSDAPNTCGFCVVEEDEIYEKMKIAHNLGFQIVIHAIGDKANRIVVNLYKKLLNEFPREDHRHRVEHASMLTEDVIKDIDEVVEAVHSHGGLAGIHCEENTDWSLLMETDLDILDFDAYDHMQGITLYPAELRKFFDRGGCLGWGIVPTLDREAAATETIPSLIARFEEGVESLVSTGFDRDQLLQRALITPSCGAGGVLTVALAERVLDLLCGLSIALRKRYGFV